MYKTLNLRNWKKGRESGKHINGMEEEGCNLTTKGGTWMCQYFNLCEGTPGAEIAYKPRERRK